MPGASSSLGDGETVVHVVDARSVGHVATVAKSIALLAAGSAATVHRVMLLGGSRDEEAARRAGIEPAIRIAPILGEGSFAWPALREACPTLDHCTVMAWGLGGLAASLRASDGRMVFVAPIGPSDGRAARVARRALTHRGVEALAWSQRAAMETESLLALPSRVVPVPIDPEQCRCDRERLRWAWGASSGSLVVGLLSEPPAWGDLRRAAEIVGFARVRGLDVRLVAHPSACRAAATRAWLRELGISDFVAFDERLSEPWRVVGAFDAGLVLADAAGLAGQAASAGRSGLGTLAPPTSLQVRAVSPAPMLWASAVDLPLIANEEAVDPPPFGEGVVRFAPDDPLAATRTLLQWCQDREACRSIGRLQREGLGRHTPARCWAAWTDPSATGNA